jgi:hypothetical protein
MLIVAVAREDIIILNTRGKQQPPEAAACRFQRLPFEQVAAGLYVCTAE